MAVCGLVITATRGCPSVDQVINFDKSGNLYTTNREKSQACPELGFSPEEYQLPYDLVTLTQNKKNRKAKNHFPVVVTALPIVPISK
jgi:hypothetical protein